MELATSGQHLHSPTSLLELYSFYFGLELDGNVSGTCDQHLHPPTSWLELDPFYSGLELDRNVSGLEPDSVDYGPESTLAECFDQNVPHLLIGTEDVEAVERENPAGPTGQEPNEDLPRTKSWHHLMIALILFMVLIAIVVSVPVMQTRNSSR